MKIFIDSADLEEIKKYLDSGLCDGVTTNPTTFLKLGIQGQNIKKRALEIAKLINSLPISFEVTSESPEEIIKQAREYASWADNIVVKITVTDSKGNSLLKVINQLVKEGIRLNITAIMTHNQAIFTAKSIYDGLKFPNAKKPHFISIFLGRIAEEFGVETAFNIVRDFRDWLDFYKFEGIEILAASIRTPENISYWSKAGADIITIPPEAISKSLLSARSKETVAQFIEDAKKSS